MAIEPWRAQMDSCCLVPWTVGICRRSRTQQPRNAPLHNSRLSATFSANRLSSPGLAAKRLQTGARCMRRSLPFSLSVQAFLLAACAGSVPAEPWQKSLVAPSFQGDRVKGAATDPLSPPRKCDRRLRRAHQSPRGKSQVRAGRAASPSVECLAALIRREGLRHCRARAARQGARCGGCGQSGSRGQGMQDNRCRRSLEIAGAIAAAEKVTIRLQRADAISRRRGRAQHRHGGGLFPAMCRADAGPYVRGVSTGGVRPGVLHHPCATQ